MSYMTLIDGSGVQLQYMSSVIVLYEATVALTKQIFTLLNESSLEHIMYPTHYVTLPS